MIVVHPTEHASDLVTAEVSVLIIAHIHRHALEIISSELMDSFDFQSLKIL